MSVQWALQQHGSVFGTPVIALYAWQALAAAVFEQRHRLEWVQQTVDIP